MQNHWEPTVVEERYEIEDMRPLRFVVGLDLGKQNDFTALVVNDLHTCNRVQYRRTAFEPVAIAVRRRRLYHHQLVNVHRYPRGTNYPAINQSVRSIMAQLPARQHPPALVVDGTGVGIPVVDAMREGGLMPVAVSITAGRDVNERSATDFTVPKTILASSIDITMAEDRLGITAQATDSTALRGELQNFRVKISAGGSTTMEAWRESAHDDLVLAASLAVWFGERPIPQPAQFLARGELWKRYPGVRFLGDQ